MRLSIYTLVATADAAAVLISVITTPSMILQINTQHIKTIG